MPKNPEKAKPSRRANAGWTHLPSVTLSPVPALPHSDSEWCLRNIIKCPASSAEGQAHRWQEECWQPGSWHLVPAGLMPGTGSSVQLWAHLALSLAAYPLRLPESTSGLDYGEGCHSEDRTLRVFCALQAPNMC